MGRTKTQPEMLDCLRNGRTPRTSLDHLLSIQEIIEASYASSRDGGAPVQS
jgi:hypothetical protein